MSLSTCCVIDDYIEIVKNRFRFGLVLQIVQNRESEPLISVPSWAARNFTQSPPESAAALRLDQDAMATRFTSSAKAVAARYR